MLSLFRLIIISVFLLLLSLICGVLPEADTVSAGNASPEAWGTSLGDVNGDGKRNIFDLLSMLQILQGTVEHTPAADLDNSGKVDVSDLVVLLQYLVNPPEKEPDLDFLLLVQHQDLFDPLIILIGGWETTGEVKFDYKLYANKEIKEFIVVLDGDTLHKKEGYTPALCNLDTIEIPTYRCHEISCGNFPWYVSVTDIDGNRRDSTGTTEIRIVFCVGLDVDGDTWLVSQPIEFPVVLEGADQAFQIDPHISREMMTVDLNRANRDSVVFTCMDSLAAAIMEDLIENDSVWHYIQRWQRYKGQLFVSPAYNICTSEKEDRLVLWLDHNAATPLILPVGENEILLGKIGFPLWIRQQAGLVDHSIYRVDSLWYEKYSNIEVSP